MSTITTRSGKGSPLTNNEVDANFTNLNNDKLESADLSGYAELTGATFTGEVEATGFNGDLTGAILFKGQAGEALTKGDPVYISGISGNKTVVSKADANDSSKMPCFGIVDATVSANADCSVVTFGTLQGLDTSSFSEGDELFVSDTGALTTTAPTGESSQIQKIGKVTRSHASAGSIKVMGAGRTNAVPNLDDGQFFLGNGSNQAVSSDFAASVLGEISAGTGIGISASGVISNTAPDQTVVLTGSGATSISGTYPNFTISSTDNNTTYSAGTGVTLAGTTFSLTDTNAKLNLTGGTLTGALSGTTATFSGNLNIESDIRVGTAAGAINQTGIIKENGSAYGLGFFTWGDTAPVQIGGGSVNLQKEAGGGVDLKINGTTVIDSSRNLTNINAITSTGVATLTRGNGSVGAPNTANHDTGTRIELYNSTATAWYAIGIESDTMWFNSDNHYRFYTDAVSKVDFDSSGVVNAVGGYKVNGTTVINSSLDLTARQATFEHTDHNYVKIENASVAKEQMVRFRNSQTSYWYAGIRTSAGIASTADFHIFSAQLGDDAFALTTSGDLVAKRNLNTKTGSIQINGTTVIDSSRNLTNVGNITAGANNYITLGPNSTWANSLRVGGNGRAATGTAMASVATTNGNLHLDAADQNRGIYLNYYAGTTGTYFGNGASATVARMHSNGQLYKSGTTANPYWNSTNDGSGSGLDADLLDGQHASAFLGVNATAAEASSLDVPDTRNSGARAPNDYADHKVTAEFTDDINGAWWSSLTVKGWHDGYAPWQLVGYSSTAQSEDFYVRFGHGSNNTWTGLRKIWHSGNDGSGSGLDADLLDGQHGSYYAPASHAHSYLPLTGGTVSGTTSFSYLTNTNGSKLEVMGSADGNQRGIYIWDSTDPNWGIYMATAGSGKSLSGGTSCSSLDGRTSHHIRFRTYGQDAARGWIFENNLEQAKVSITSDTGKIYSTGDHYVGSNVVWNAGNDGSGSGLDADLLDGTHKTGFFVQGGSWLGDLGSHGYTRENGLSMTGGSEFVVLSKNGQGSVLVDGQYISYESSNGFFGSYNSSYGNASGIRATAASTVSVMQLDGGNASLAVTGDLRAPIFYDSANTGYYIDPATTSNVLSLIMPHRGNGTENIKVNNGQQENWRAINVAMGGSNNAGIGYGNNTRSVFNRHNLAFHCSQYDSIRFHSDGWDTLFEVAGASGDAWLKGQLQAPQLHLAGTSNTSYSSPNIKSYGTSNTAGVVNYHIRFNRQDGTANGHISTNYYATTYSTTSDYRVKEDVQPMGDATSRIMALNPVNFQWKDSDIRTDGFIAHEVAEVVSDAVVGEKDAVDEKGNDELQSLDQSKLVPLLVKTIQEQQSVIEALEARISALEA